MVGIAQFPGLGMYDEGGKFEVKQEFIDAAKAKAIEEGKKYYGDATNFEVFRDGVLNLPDSAINFVLRGAEGTGELVAGITSLVMKGGQLATTTDPDRLTQLMSEPSITKYMGAYKNKIPTPNLYESDISGMEDTEKAFGTAGYYTAPVPVVPIAKGAGQIAKGLASTNIGKNIADELGTAVTYFPQYTPFKNIEPKSVGAASASGAKVGLNNARNEIVTNLNKFFKNKNMDELTEADLDANIVSNIITDAFNKYDIKRIGKRGIRSDTEYKRLYDAGLINDKLLSKITTYGNKLKSRQIKLDAGKVRKKKADLALSFLEGTQAANLNKPLLYRSLSKKYPDSFPVVTETRMREVIDQLIEKRPALSDYLGLKRKVDPDTLKPLKMDEKGAFKSYLTNNLTMKEVFKTFKESDRTLVKSYLDMIRRSSPGSKKPVGENFDEFMSSYANEIQDLKNPNSVFYKNYKTFVNYENLRVSVQDDIKSVLDKIYKAPKKRPDGTIRTEAQRIKEAPNTVQVAHAFESSQIDKTIGQNKMKLGTQEVSTMEGAGGLPQSYYLDLSQLNQVRQPSIEAKLRKAIDKGDQQAINKANIELEEIGARVTIDGKEYGRHKFLTEKLDEIEDKLLTRGKEFDVDNPYGITKQEYEKFKKGQEKLQSEVISFKKKGIDINMFKGGGLVGISHLTRPLREF